MLRLYESVYTYFPCAIIFWGRHGKRNNEVPTQFPHRKIKSQLYAGRFIGKFLTTKRLVILKLPLSTQLYSVERQIQRIPYTGYNQFKGRDFRMVASCGNIESETGAKICDGDGPFLGIKINKTKFKTHFCEINNRFTLIFYIFIVFTACITERNRFRVTENLITVHSEHCSCQ